MKITLEKAAQTTHYVFRQSEDEKRELFTNRDVERFAVDDFCRYELIGGEICISRMPVFLHQFVSMKIMLSFFSYLEKHPTGFVLPTCGLIFSGFDGVIPDLIYISHKRRDEILNEKDGKFHGAPELVIEILSPGRVNTRRDLLIKRELYEIYGVPEYRVIKPQEKQIEVFRLDGESEIYSENDAVETNLLPELKFAVKQLFAG